jgi:L,D-transpeptidase catalytic domain
MGLLTVASASAAVVTAAAVARAQDTPGSALTASPASGRHSATTGRDVAGANQGRRPGLSAKPGAAAPAAAGPLTLTARDWQLCPPQATACVDLTRHITWLQSAGKVSFGPVRAEPGPPGSAHATPTGTFHVSWKAGPTYISTEYNEPMPWAVFFAPGGIAFHGGSLTTPSHGCVHLTVANAHYYNEHLPVGAEVVVF